MAKKTAEKTEGTVYGYIRVSTDRQDAQKQRFEILEHINRHGLRITEENWIEVTMSSRKSEEKRRIVELLDRLQVGDAVIVSELSRFGRDLVPTLVLVSELVTTRGIRVVSIKQGIDYVPGKLSFEQKVQLTFALLMADWERDFISRRTKQALAAVRASGRTLGRPTGSLGKSKLDGKEAEIKELLDKDISKSAIAKLVNSSRANLLSFLDTRGMGEYKKTFKKKVEVVAR